MTTESPQNMHTLKNADYDNNLSAVRHQEHSEQSLAVLPGKNIDFPRVTAIFHNPFGRDIAVISDSLKTLAASAISTGYL